ncbi:MAG: hypothetical protein J7578_18020 [Chitinophagaceae bacterium]|nr:hypothetical protein [Chitinophagaceae bacterium]
MKTLFFALLICSCGLAVTAQDSTRKAAPKSIILKNKVVEMACGECQFKMNGKGCNLAIRIDGKSYFVDGKDIDDFGDAHADDGFCNHISKALVSGEIINNRFKPTEIKLLKNKK